MSEAIYPMRVAAARAGLSPHVIRVWERRYGAVVPHRSGTNRRLYSEADINRLNLLRRAVEAGQSIGQLAGLPDERLKAIVGSARGVAQPAGRSEPGPDARPPAEYIQEALKASRALDALALESVLSRAAVESGDYAFVTQVVAPLLDRIGELWRSGELRVSQEHLTSGVVRSALGGLASRTTVEDSAPVILLATPSGQRHELGCLMASVAAGRQGWRSLYLGADLPADEIVAAAEQSGARVVGLSLVYPSGDGPTSEQLLRTRSLLPDSTTIIVGGRAAHTYASTLERIQAMRVSTLDDLQTSLETLAAA